MWRGVVALARSGEGELALDDASDVPELEDQRRVTMYMESTESLTPVRTLQLNLRGNKVGVDGAVALVADLLAPNSQAKRLTLRTMGASYTAQSEPWLQKGEKAHVQRSVAAVAAIRAASVAGAGAVLEVLGGLPRVVAWAPALPAHAVLERGAIAQWPPVHEGLHLPCAVAKVSSGLSARLESSDFGGARRGGGAHVAYPT